MLRDAPPNQVTPKLSITPRTRPPTTRAGQVAEAAERRRGEALDAGGKAHARVDVAVIHADQHAADAGERRRDRERERLEPAGVDAHLQGRVAVLGGRAQGPAEARVHQEQPEREQAGQGHAEHHQVGGAEADLADLEAAAGQQVGEHLRLGREDELRDAVEDERDGDRGEQRRDPRRLGQRPHRDALDRDAEQRGDGGDAGERQRQRPVQHGSEVPAEHRAEREHRAVREVDEVGDAEDQRQAERDQGIGVAVDQPGDQRVEELRHRPSAASAVVGELVILHRDQCLVVVGDAAFLVELEAAEEQARDLVGTRKALRMPSRVAPPCSAPQATIQTAS